jgi:hypothetical protein
MANQVQGTAHAFFPMSWLEKNSRARRVHRNTAQCAFDSTASSVIRSTIRVRMTDIGEVFADIEIHETRQTGANWPIASLSAVLS